MKLHRGLLLRLRFKPSSQYFLRTLGYVKDIRVKNKLHPSKLGVIYS